MKKETPKTSQDVITGLKIEGDHTPPKNRNIVNQQPEINDEKDLDEESHSETDEPLKEDEENDADEIVHQRREDDYAEDKEGDIDDMLHKGYKGIY